MKISENVVISIKECLGIGMVRVVSQGQKKRWDNGNYNYKRNKIT